MCIRFTPNFDFILARDENKLEFPEPSGKETLQRWFLPSVRAPALFPPVLLSVILHFGKAFKYCGWVFIVVAVFFFFFLRNILALFKIKVSWNERTTSSEQKSHWKQKRRQTYFPKEIKNFPANSFWISIVSRMWIWFGTVPSLCPALFIANAWNFSWIEEMDPKL